MTLLCSMTSGLILDSDQISPRPLFLNSEDSSSWDSPESLHVLSTVSDWQILDGASHATIIAQATHDYWVRRCSDISRCVLAGISSTLEEETLIYLEDLVSTRVNRDLLLSYLLIAPLSQPNAAQRIAQRALGRGLPIIGKVFDDIYNLQPLVQRLSDLWLALPPHLFISVAGTRQHLWVRLAESGVLRKVLEARSAKSFRTEWNILTWEEKSPASRSAVVAIGAAIADKLSGFGALVYQLPEDATDSYFDDESSPYAKTKPKQKPLSWSESRDWALSQVRAIIREIAAGRDARAKEYLDALVNEQVSSDKAFAVKSLCN